MNKFAAFTVASLFYLPLKLVFKVFKAILANPVVVIGSGITFVMRVRLWFRNKLGPTKLAMIRINIFPKGLKVAPL